MNYSFDTEMDLGWSADQLRRAKHAGTGLGDEAIRRVTATRRAAPVPTPGGLASGQTVAVVPSGRAATRRPADPPEPGPLAEESSLGTLLSALSNTASPEHIARLCEELLLVLSERGKLALHAEFVQLRGVEAVIDVVRTHPGPVSLPALRILEKLARSSAREVAAAGGIDVVVQVCERGGQAALVADINKSNKEAPLLLEAALKTLLGLTFDDVSRGLLSRNNVVELAEALLRAQPGVESGEGTSTEAEQASLVAWQDVMCASRRLLQRLGGTAPKPTAAGREDGLPGF